MTSKSSTTLLASFSTIKALSDERKYQSAYQILAEFIRDIIIEESLFVFQAVEMKNRLNSRFGFDIPEAVVKTSARKMSGVTLNNGFYTVSISDLGTDSLFKEKQREADETNRGIFIFLTEYIESRENKPVNNETLTQDLVAFLLDEQNEAQGKYTDYIAEFILKNEHDANIQDGLTKIREGSILYIGLSHSICETGSITKPLSLYLGTEILFSLVGFNGEIFTQLASDFFRQIRVANRNERKIHLFYFSDVKKEIDDFFFAAEEIIGGKESSFLMKPAMIAITNGCSTSADVRVKQSDFYHRLKYEFGINEDPCNDYYDETLFKTNLESAEYFADEEKAKKREAGIKYISHINKLRGGPCYSNDLESGYLLVTNTKTTLLISKEQSDTIKDRENVDFISDFAVSLDRITSLLWYKLGNGFSNTEYPKNISSALKARIVLSTIIAKNADIAFSDIKKQYKDGKISDEQLAARIITLKNKPTLPEELQGDYIDEIMDFSPAFLNRYEEQVVSDRKALQEKNTAIAEKDKVIEEQAGIIAEKDAALSERETTILEQEKTIKAQAGKSKALQRELAAYHNKEAKEKQKRKKRQKVFRTIITVLLLLAATAALVFISIFICNRISPNYTSAISISIGIIGVVVTIVLSVMSSKKNNNSDSE